MTAMFIAMTKDDKGFVEHIGFGFTHTAADRDLVRNGGSFGPTYSATRLADKDDFWGVTAEGSIVASDIEVQAGPSSVLSETGN